MLIHLKYFQLLLNFYLQLFSFYYNFKLCTFVWSSKGFLLNLLFNRYLFFTPKIDTNVVELALFALRLFISRLKHHAVMFGYFLTKPFMTIILSLALFIIIVKTYKKIRNKVLWSVKIMSPWELYCFIITLVQSLYCLGSE